MRKIKVLFIDDDVTFGNVIMLTLEALGYDAHYQSSLAAINDVIWEIKPDIIILDVEIGRKNSLEALPEIKATIEDIPIIFVSSHTDASFVTKALKLGGVAYLKKPFKNEELIAYINRFACANEEYDLKFGKYVLNGNERSLFYNGVLVKQLSSKEYKLLRLLVLNINTVVKRDIIIDKVWDQKIVSGHSIANFIARLRTYMSEDKEIELVTVQNVGYRLMVKISV